VKLPRASGKQAVEAFFKAGYFIHRIGGSHYILKQVDTGRRVVIPYHRKELAPKTLQTILRQAGISSDTFLGLL
jgi:predicted RNA binding protein YcfA (HicA-like mRNA interferase family)